MLYKIFLCILIYLLMGNNADALHKRKSLKPLKVQEQLPPHTLMPEDPLASLTVEKGKIKKAHLEKFLNAMIRHLPSSQHDTKIK